MFAAGPDFKKGKTVRSEMKSIDVCPTICELLGVKSEHRQGQGDVFDPDPLENDASPQGRRTGRAPYGGLFIAGATGRRPGHDAPKAERKPDPGCISCHQGLEVMHPWDPLSCTDCHGGDGKANRQGEGARPPDRSRSERRAHRRPEGTTLKYRRFVNPTDLRVVAEHVQQVPRGRVRVRAEVVARHDVRPPQRRSLRERRGQQSQPALRDLSGERSGRVCPGKHGFKSLPAIPRPSIGASQQDRTALLRPAAQVVHALPSVLARPGRAGTARDRTAGTARRAARRATCSTTPEGLLGVRRRVDRQAWNRAIRSSTR